MSVIGIVRNGVVEFPPDSYLKEGQHVEIVPTPMATEEAFVLRETATSSVAITELPDDMAVNHDYYLHGQGKQQPRRGRWIRAEGKVSEMSESEVAEFTGKLLALAAETRNLPPDLSTNHDHYLHGLPKK
jgi:hypothetical protein